MYQRKKTITIKILAGAAAVLMTWGLFMPQLAQARLDELIRVDAPYFAVSETVGAAKTAAAAETATRLYIVRQGDTLGAIAMRHSVDVDSLAEMNNLRNRDSIFLGQALRVPGTSFPYRVKKGDSLSVIASKFGVGKMELVRNNNLTNPDRLLEGQVLDIPAGRGGGSVRVTRALPLNQLKWPVAGWISSTFGLRDGAMHEGIDIAADHGQTVRTVKSGRVAFSGPRGTYGNTVIIDHGDGLRTLYAHNSQLLVRQGQRVLENQPIARVGSTGRSTGPHLHLEVLLNGIPFDPLLCLTGSGPSKL